MSPEGTGVSHHIEDQPISTFSSLRCGACGYDTGPPPAGQAFLLNLGYVFHYCPNCGVGDRWEEGKPWKLSDASGESD